MSRFALRHHQTVPQGCAGIGERRLCVVLSAIVGIETAVTRGSSDNTPDLRLLGPPGSLVAVIAAEFAPRRPVPPTRVGGMHGATRRGWRDMVRIANAAPILPPDPGIAAMDKCEPAAIA